MADILITGTLEHFPVSAAMTLAEDFRVVMAGKQMRSMGKGRRLASYDVEPSEEQFGQLFDVYSFKSVCFVSGFSDGGKGRSGEIQQLERLLEYCETAKVEKIIVLSTVETLNYGIEGRGDSLIRKEYLSRRALLAAQIEELCRYCAEKSGIRIITLHLPYLADLLHNDENFLGTVFETVSKGKTLSMEAGETDRIDFLSARDLSRLLQCIIDEDEDSSQTFFVCSGYGITTGMFAEKLKELAGNDVNIRFQNTASRIPWSGYPNELRKIYGFIPMDCVFEELKDYYEEYLKTHQTAKQSFTEKLRNYFLRQDGYFKYVELAVIFILVEVLNSYMSVSVYFKFVDIRLLFIMMMATIYGMRMGLYAAGLECLVLMLQYGKIGMDWTLLFYNIENWIPFATYLMAGSVAGYIKNKNSDELRFMKEEHRLLYDKYMFLNNAYHGALENKKEYKKQIIGFKDSFGKIFDAVQRLDSMVPQKIYFEGLKVMEDILENRTIAIYSLDQWQKFGRLAVCSSSMTSTLPKSLHLAEYQELYDTVKAGNVWKNVELLPDQPMYADGVFQEGQLALLIVVYHAGPEQYGVRYMNIFHILCGLVQSSFLRARNYEQWLEEKIYYPGTSVVYPERFLEVVRAQEEMKRSGVADYVLLKLEEKDLKKASESMAGVIRSTDMLGSDGNGNLYVLLAQAGMDTFHFVGDRLEKKKVSYEIVKKVG